MKWNDIYLPYFGEQKVIIHKYILSATKDIKKFFNKETLTPKHIINYIKDDMFWDTSIFKNQSDKTWLLNEINKNPSLIAFLITEIEKIIDFPDMYVIPETDSLKSQTELKSEEFGKRVFSFIKSNPQLPHIYFSQADSMEIKDDINDFIQNEPDCIMYRSKTPPPEFEKTFTIKYVLEKFIGIKCQPYLNKARKPFINIVSHDVDLLLVQWGNFPTFSASNIKPKLFCLIDEFSIYILGIADEELLLQYSSSTYTFSENATNSDSRLAFYGFHELNAFSFNEIDKYKKEND